VVNTEGNNTEENNLGNEIKKQVKNNKMYRASTVNFSNSKFTTSLTNKLI